MREPARAFPRGRPPAARLGALALLALAACTGRSEGGATEPICIKCLPEGSAPPPEPWLPLSHHGIVRGTVRDAAGAPVAGARPEIAAWASTRAATLYEVEGKTPTPADGSFRLRYTVGLGPRPDSATVELLVWRPGGGFGTGVPIRAKLPVPRPASGPADSVQITVVLPPL